MRAGEIVGIAGLVGAGRTELIQAVFGVSRPLSGEVRLSGKLLNISSPQDAINAGLALVPEDRKQHGLVLEMPIRNNVGLAGLQRHSRPPGFLNQSKEASDTKRMIDDMRIRTPGPEQIVRFLSGGNQQKVVIGKWLALEPKLLLLDEPTRGIDLSLIHI